MAEVIDALPVSWSSENNWVFPPPFLVLKVLKHMLRYGADKHTHCSSLGISTMVAFTISSQGQVQERNMRFLDYTPMHKYVYPSCPRVNNVWLRKDKC